jgi:hypothetical protein
LRRTVAEGGTDVFAVMFSDAATPPDPRTVAPEATRWRPGVLLVADSGLGVLLDEPAPALLLVADSGLGVLLDEPAP